MDESPGSSGPGFAANPAWYHAPRVHAVIYALLLLVAPFLMVRRYLQVAVGHLSRIELPVAELGIPVVGIAAVVAAALLLYRWRRLLTRTRGAAIVTGLAMIALAQQIGDHYFAHRAYDLQLNWHYLAYGIFAFVLSRDLSSRGLPPARIIWLTFWIALGLSVTDELFQLLVSSRTFDTGDIAKDVWGVLAGMVIIHGGDDSERGLLKSWRPLRKPHLRDYRQAPASLLLLLIWCGFVFLNVASLLTSIAYGELVVVFTVAISFAGIMVFHYSSRPRFRVAAIVTAGLILLLQGAICLRHRGTALASPRPGVTLYHGLPIAFFDAIIFPGGGFRLADKKASFNQRDQWYLLSHKPDVILLASGPRGRGGRGFPENTTSQFIYNIHTRDATQVVTLPNREALTMYNRLKEAKKNVLLVLHNTD